MKKFIVVLIAALAACAGSSGAIADSALDKAAYDTRLSNEFVGAGKLVGGTLAVAGKDGRSLASYAFSIEDESGKRFDIDVNVEDGFAQVFRNGVDIGIAPITFEQREILEASFQRFARPKTWCGRQNCDDSQDHRREYSQCRMVNLPTGAVWYCDDSSTQCDPFVCAGIVIGIIGVGVGVAGIVLDEMDRDRNCQSQMARDSSQAYYSANQCRSQSHVRPDGTRVIFVPDILPANPQLCIGSRYAGCRQG